MYEDKEWLHMVKEPKARPQRPDQQTRALLVEAKAKATVVIVQVMVQLMEAMAVCHQQGGGGG